MNGNRSNPHGGGGGAHPTHAAQARTSKDPYRTLGGLAAYYNFAFEEPAELLIVERGELRVEAQVIHGRRLVKNIPDAGGVGFPAQQLDRGSSSSCRTVASAKSCSLKQGRAPTPCPCRPASKLYVNVKTLNPAMTAVPALCRWSPC